MSFRSNVAYLLIAEAALTEFVPEQYMPVAAQSLLFPAVSHEVWAITQTVMAVVLLVTARSGRYEATGRLCGAAVTAAWGCTTLGLALNGSPWAATNVILWAAITAMAVLANTHRLLMVAAALWAALAVAFALAPDQALAASALRGLIDTTGRAPVTLVCGAVAVLIGYRSRWPSRQSWAVAATIAGLGYLAWAAVWLAPLWSTGRFNCVAVTAWAWLALTSAKGLAQYNRIPTYPRPTPHPT